MKRILMAIVFVGIMTGCGKKFPLPEESDIGMPSEKEYVEIQNTEWDNIMFSNVKDVFLGEDGYVYVLSSDTLYKFSTTGEYGNVFSVLFDAVSVSQDIEENIYVATGSGTVVKYSWDGSVLDTFDFSYLCQDTTLQDSFLTSIDAAGDNHFVMSFAPLNLVVRFCNDSIDTVATYGTGIEYTRKPMGVYARISPAIVLYASSENNWVEGLSLMPPHFNMIHLGGDSYDGGTEDTLFMNPLDVYMDDSSCVYVLDKGNMAMKKFDFEGGLITVLRLSDDPVAITVSHDGKTLYIAFKDRIRKYKLPEIPGEGGEG